MAGEPDHMAEECGQASAAVWGTAFLFGAGLGLGFMVWVYRKWIAP